MGESTHTIKVAADTAEVEQGLTRCIELAERFRVVWGDQPLPGAIERLEFNPGDHVVLRYDEELDGDAIEAIKEQARKILPGAKPVVLTGGLRLAGVLASASMSDEMPDPEEREAWKGPKSEEEAGRGRDA